MNITKKQIHTFNGRLSFMQAKQSKAAEGILAKRMESSFCMYKGELSTLHKILKIGRRDFEKKTIFLFFCPESISKVDPGPIQSDPTMTLFDGSYLE